MKKVAVMALGLMFSGAAYAVPTTVADLGALDGDTTISGSLAVNGVNWYSFEASSFSYLDIATMSSLDTEIGLYDSLGNLIANDDDDGVGLLSVLSFGTGSGLMLGDGFNLGGDGIANGEDGGLGDGLYYLAIGEFNTTFGATGFDVVSDGPDTGGDYQITFYTDATAPTGVPVPATLALLGIGLIGFGIRRRA